MNLGSEWRVGLPASHRVGIWNLDQSVKSVMKKGGVGKASLRTVRIGGIILSMKEGLYEKLK